MRPALYVHALRAARGRQLRARALRPLSRRRFGAPPARPFHPLGAAAAGLWRSPAFTPVILAGEGPERLRSFHAHYGEDVLAAARDGDEASALALVREWIARNPPRPGDAWHPYPASTRAGSWIAALSLLGADPPGDVAASLWLQLWHVARNVEDDVLGNHVIRNARALVLGGIAFDAPELFELGAELLERELPEQVLPDGGHYERSPVYHLVVLRDLLEVDAASPGLVPAATLDRMRAFAAALARPDGAPALFNDGGLDLAPRLELPAPPDGLAVFADTGYAVVRREGLWLAFDCGPPGPPYLPAHAHADALSFQLWLDGRPVVVDPGMPTYEAGAERDRFRGTAAHATVAVDGRDQFELWGAFRSGPLPRVELLDARPDRLSGRVTRPDGVAHEREIELRADGLRIRDRVSRSLTVVSALPLAPETALEPSPLGPLPVARERRQVFERMYAGTWGVTLVQRGDAHGRETGWTVALDERDGPRLPERAGTSLDEPEHGAG